MCGKIRYEKGKILYHCGKICYLRGKNRHTRERFPYIRGHIRYANAGFVTLCNDLMCVGVFLCLLYVCVCVCVCHLKRPFASELETNLNEMNVSQVSATLYTFMGYFFVCVCVCL